MPLLALYWQRLKITLRWVGLALLFAIVIAPEWPAFQDERHQVNTIIGQRHFDFLTWEVDALAVKAEAALGGGHTLLDQAARRQLVLDYLDQLRETQAAEREIARLYADPAVADPQAASAELVGFVNRQRVYLSQRQALAEAIVQEEVAHILEEEGFGLLGQAWPPVLMHMTELPLLLVVSPREEIRQAYALPLEPGLAAADIEEVESVVYKQVNRSGLIVPLGGLGLYPAMVVETNSINRLVEVTAHEWAHHWLTLRPLGLYYAASPELRTINETVASIIGDEVGRSVIERFYLAFVPPDVPPAPPQAAPPAERQPAFDPNAVLSQTRIRVDALLAQGQVAEAEAYMEQQRQYLWDNGFRLRKLNQAFFAFYGAYADTPGERGDDPIGPAILRIRANSPTLQAFAETMASITSLDELLVAAGSAGS